MKRRCGCGQHSNYCTRHGVAFPVQIDPWLAVPLALGVSVPPLLLVRSFAAGRQGGLTTVLLLILFVALASLVVVSYSVTEDAIIVRRGI